MTTLASFTSVQQAAETLGRLASTACPKCKYSARKCVCTEYGQPLASRDFVAPYGRFSWDDFVCVKCESVPKQCSCIMPSSLRHRVARPASWSDLTPALDEKWVSAIARLSKSQQTHGAAVTLDKNILESVANAIETAVHAKQDVARLRIFACPVEDATRLLDELRASGAAIQDGVESTTEDPSVAHFSVTAGCDCLRHQCNGAPYIVYSCLWNV